MTQITGQDFSVLGKVSQGLRKAPKIREPSATAADHFFDGSSFGIILERLALS